MGIEVAGNATRHRLPFGKCTVEVLQLDSRKLATCPTYIVAATTPGFSRERLHRGGGNNEEVAPRQKVVCREEKPAALLLEENARNIYNEISFVALRRIYVQRLVPRGIT